jgi:hypothetical protein
MGTAKGVNTFETFQLEKQQRRETLIAEFLAYLKTSRVQTPYVTDLAEVVSNHISAQEGKPCNKATLLRNPRYKSMLLSYMAATLAKGTKDLKSKDIKDPKAQALVISTQIESGNLKRDNERLRAYVAILESKISDLGANVEPENRVVMSANSAEIESTHIKYVRICQALHAVIVHMQPTLSVDISSRRILDMSKLRNNVVVDSDIAGGFFDWLEANKGIG